jgi:NADPH-dependent F420 reductase
MTEEPERVSPSPTVAIIGGTGNLGLGLSLRLAAAGVPIVIGSRDPDRAVAAAAEARALVPGGPLEGRVNRDAVRDAQVVVLAVPLAAHAATLAEVAPGLGGGQVLVDATVPLATALGGKPTRTLMPWAGSVAQLTQELVGDDVPVVSALHTVAAASLTDLTRELDEDVLLCGDRRADKETVARLLSCVPGLRCIDAGRLEMSRVVEQLTALMISINIRHKAHAGIKITGLDGSLA